jgi:L-threonylcarbamoyladenylate synthase
MASTPPFDTTTIKADAGGIKRAAAIITKGGCVAVPTETVYGLAADATNGEAVAGIYAAKGRPSFNPLIVHVSDLAQAQELAELNAEALALAKAHWPGPLTLVLPLKPNTPIASLVTAGLSTIAIRVPAHAVMQALLKASGRPLAAPSANASGTISPTQAHHVARSLSGRIPLILDGGATAHGLESTIIAVRSNGSFAMLRPGPIDLGLAVEASASIEAPGQLASHYAPAKPLRLHATAPHANEWMIGFGPTLGDDNLSETGDLKVAAANLFAALHRADQSRRTAIAIAPIPYIGLGVAINDRLSRAAA